MGVLCLLEGDSLKAVARSDDAEWEARALERESWLRLIESSERRSVVPVTLDAQLFDALGVPRACSFGLLLPLPVRRDALGLP